MDISWWLICPMVTLERTFWRFRKKLLGKTHEIGTRKRHATTGMLNVDQHAEGTLQESVLVRHRDRASIVMTLSEKIQALFEQFRLPVFFFLLRKTRDSGRAEDIVQETFLRLFRHLTDERPDGQPQSVVVHGCE